MVIYLSCCFLAEQYVVEDLKCCPEDSFSYSIRALQIFYDTTIYDTKQVNPKLWAPGKIPKVESNKPNTTDCIKRGVGVRATGFISLKEEIGSMIL
uniref:Uncharacterized protein n=1 Tax=Tanacetum cinerariifolium TaxID=118510 RepID=A0A6L2J788_TANCI|nr:hypothetical protein [Tanacetum cinerariifolium]